MQRIFENMCYKFMAEVIFAFRSFYGNSDLGYAEAKGLKTRVITYMSPFALISFVSRGHNCHTYENNVISDLFYILLVIYQTRERVFHQDIQTPRSELKKRGAAEFF